MPKSEREEMAGLRRYSYHGTRKRSKSKLSSLIIDLFDHELCVSLPLTMLLYNDATSNSPDSQTTNPRTGRVTKLINQSSD